MKFEYRDAIINRKHKQIKNMITEFRPKFYSVLKRYGADEVECQEYFQIALKEIVEHLVLDEQKDIPDPKFFNYLLTIGLNKWRSYCKLKRKETPTIDLPDKTIESTVLDDMIRREEHTAFMQKFRSLRVECQNLLWSKLVENHSYKEIATLTNKSEKYLRVHLNRCKKYLIKLLAGDNNFQFK